MSALRASCHCWGAIWGAIALALTGFAVATPATAEPASAWNDHPNARVRLVAHDATTVGLEVTLAPGWKTYWRMPGDAGVPPSFDWAGSTNLASAVPLFPIPRAIPEAGGTAIGYKEAVVFPIRLTAAQARDPIALRLVFSFGVCREICIPVDSTLALDLPGNGTGRTPAPAVTAALARVPTVVPDATRATPALLATQFKLDTAKPMLRFETKGAVDLFVEAPEGLFLPMPRQVSAGVWEIDLAQAPDFPEMRGQRLRVTLAREDGGIETTVRVPAK